MTVGRRITDLLKPECVPQLRVEESKSLRFRILSMPAVRDLPSIWSSLHLGCRRQAAGASLHELQPKIDRGNIELKIFLDMLLKSNPALLIRLLPPAAVPGASFGSGGLTVRRTSVLHWCLALLRTHLALTEDLAMRTYDFAPCGARPSASTVFSISSTKPSTEPSTTTRPTISSDLAKIGIRSRWRWLVSALMRSR